MVRTWTNMGVQVFTKDIWWVISYFSLSQEPPKGQGIYLDSQSWDSLHCGERTMVLGQLHL